MSDKGVTIFNSDGSTMQMSEEKDRRLIEQMTPFECSLCQYPVLMTWRFCPHCGGMLEWSVEKQGRNRTGRVNGWRITRC